MVFNATFNNSSIISISFYAMTYMNNQLASVVVCIHSLFTFLLILNNVCCNG